MCGIAILKSGDGRTLRVDGHAEGCPEACHGISALVLALAGWLRNSGEAVRVCRYQKGDAEISYCATPEGEAAFECVAIGLAQIAKKYPETVRLSWIE